MRVLLDTAAFVSALLFGDLLRVLLRTRSAGEIIEDVLIGEFGFGRAVPRLTRGEVEALADLVQPAGRRRPGPCGRDRDR